MLIFLSLLLYKYPKLLSGVHQKSKTTHHLIKRDRKIEREREMSDIAMLVAEEYERRVKNSKKSGGGGCGGGGEGGGGGGAGEEIGFISSVSAIAMRLEGSSWVKKLVGEENTEIVKWVLEPKSQIGLAAINGFFSA